MKHRVELSQSNRTNSSKVRVFVRVQVRFQSHEFARDWSREFASEVFLLRSIALQLAPQHILIIRPLAYQFTPSPWFIFDVPLSRPAWLLGIDASSPTVVLRPADVVAMTKKIYRFFVRQYRETSSTPTREKMLRIINLKSVVAIDRVPLTNNVLSGPYVPLACDCYDPELAPALSLSENSAFHPFGTPDMIHLRRRMWKRLQL